MTATRENPRIPPEPTWRKPVGMIGLMLYLTIYALAVTGLADWLGTLPQWLMIPAYVALGFAWLLPLKPLFLWMNTGRWRLGSEG